mmetsp:Transcript_79593/g.241566  ORF Transcript_79593/g.241566 Transcript_79593/m.241566 type:complete len:323 (+) Transcript_79593:392-1360(+)
MLRGGPHLHAGVALQRLLLADSGLQAGKLGVVAHGDSLARTAQLHPTERQGCEHLGSALVGPAHCGAEVPDPLHGGRAEAVLVLHLERRRQCISRKKPRLALSKDIQRKQRERLHVATGDLELWAHLAGLPGTARAACRLSAAIAMWAVWRRCAAACAQPRACCSFRLPRERRLCEQQLPGGQVTHGQEAAAGPRTKYATRHKLRKCREGQGRGPAPLADGAVLLPMHTGAGLATIAHAAAASTSIRRPADAAAAAYAFAASWRLRQQLAHGVLEFAQSVRRRALQDAASGSKVRPGCRDTHEVGVVEDHKGARPWRQPSEA